MSIEFSEVAYCDGYNKGYVEGLAAGRAEGSNMRLRWADEAYDRGFDKGYEEGLTAGRAEERETALRSLKNNIGLWNKDGLASALAQFVHQCPISLELRTEIEQYIKEFLAELKVDDIVRFTDNNNPPFKITKIDKEKGWAWGVAQDGMTYAGVELSRLEKVTL